MATGYPTKVNFSTGDILTAAQMNDLSGTVNYTQYMKPWNILLNSNMSVWQRGTSFTVGAASPYTADRWQANRAGLATGLTVSRQATGDTTNLPFIQYCARVQRDSGNTSTATTSYWQNVESLNSIPFAGKAVTLSFYARAGANYSATSNALNYNLYSGTGTDQNVNVAGFTGATQVITGNATLTTTWQRFSFTATVAASATQLATLFVSSPTGTAGTNDYYEITGVQVEQGSVANTYQPNQPTYTTEVAACQRYYFRQNTNNSVSNFAVYGTGFANTTGLLNIPVVFPVTMRRPPASLETSAMATFGWEVGVSGGNSPTTITIDTNYTSADGGLAVVAKAATWVVGTYYRFEAYNSNTSYLGWSAEL